MKRIGMLSCAIAAAVSPVSAEVKLSEKLTKIASHLGEGGVHFSVTDAENDFRDMARFGDKIVANLPDAGLPPNLNFEQLLDDLGVYSYLGRGYSSHQIGNLWHNRSFILTDGKHEGVFSLLGESGTESVGATFAPAGADLVIETSIDLREVERTARKVSKAFGPEADSQVKDAFSEQITELGLTMADLFADFTVHGTIVFWMDDEKTFEVEEGVSLPVPHLAARLDNAGTIWKILKPQLEQDSRIEEKDGEILVTPPEGPLPTPFGEVLPTIVYSPKTKQLFLGLTAGDLAACRGDGPKLGDTQPYQFATIRFPKKVNSQIYLSGDVFRLAEKLIDQFLPQAPPEGQEIIKGILPYLKDLGTDGGYGAVVAVQEEGILSATNLPFPVKGESSLLGPGGIGGIAVLSGLATPAILKAKKSADKAQTINDLKMVATAMLLFRAEKGRYPNTMAEMIRANVLDGDIDTSAIEIVPQKGGEDAESILAYQELPEMDLVIVAYGDGSVQSLPFEVFQAQMLEQEGE